jgi:hypothetical protein
MGLWWLAGLTAAMLCVVAVRTNNAPKRVDLHKTAAETEEKKRKIETRSWLDGERRERRREKNLKGLLIPC